MGKLDGTAKYYYSGSGAVETRIYENGVLQVCKRLSNSMKVKVGLAHIPHC